MFTKGLLLTAAVGIVIGSTPNAGAADLCFRYTKTGGGTLVARGAAIPARDTCEPLALFESGGGAGAANGMICREGGPDNTTIRFHYTYDSCLGPSYFESGTCYIQVNQDNTTVSSSCRGTLATAGSASPFLTNDGVLESCSGITIGGGGGGACFGTFFFHAPGPATAR